MTRQTDLYEIADLLFSGQITKTEWREIKEELTDAEIALVLREVKNEE